MKIHNYKKLPPVSGQHLLQGLSAAWPICLGYLPIGLAFGVLAQKAGLTPLQIGLMSLVVFAGSSQFIAVAMLAAGASTVSIVVTTFMVNLRHLLMSSSLSMFFNRAGRFKLTFFAYGVTDESFAVNNARFGSQEWDLNRSLIVNQTANLMWVVSTVTGGCFGHLIPMHAFGIDYALTAMFICLLVYQLKNKVVVITAVMAGMLAVVLALCIPGNIYIVLASIVAAGVGVFLKRMNWQSRN